MSNQGTVTRSVGLVGGAPFLTQACEEALDGLATVKALEVPSADGSVSVQAVLVTSTFVLDHGVRWLESCRAWNGTMPIVLLPSHEHADVGEELLRSTVDDVVPIASIPASLRASLLPHVACGPEWPFLAPPLLLPPRVARNRRRCYRAHPPAGTAAAIATVEGFEIDLALEDLSIPARGAAGGMRFGCDPGLASPIELLAPGQSLPLRLQLADSADPIEVQGAIVAGTVRRTVGSLCFAARYTADDPIAVRQIRSFWVRCQRRAELVG